MDIKIVRQLVEVLEKSDLQDLQIEENGLKVYLSKPDPVPHSVSVQNPLPPVAMPNTATTLVNEIKQGSQSIGGAEKTIRSPMVGTFYRSPSPDAKPFIEVGDKINKGDVVCIIEAMKMMNQIESDVSGVVKKICVNDATAVEFDHVLIVIE